MEAGGLEEARARARTPQDPQTTCSFLLDLVHDDYSPYYSLRCIPSDTYFHMQKILDRIATFTHTLSVNASALPLAQRLQSILPLGV